MVLSDSNGHDFGPTAENDVATNGIMRTRSAANAVNHARRPDPRAVSRVGPGSRSGFLITRAQCSQGSSDCVRRDPHQVWMRLARSVSDPRAPTPHARERTLRWRTRRRRRSVIRLGGCDRIYAPAHKLIRSLTALPSGAEGGCRMDARITRGGDCSPCGWPRKVPIQMLTPTCPGIGPWSETSRCICEGYEDVIATWCFALAALFCVSEAIGPGRPLVSGFARQIRMTPSCAASYLCALLMGRRSRGR